MTSTKAIEKLYEFAVNADGFQDIIDLFSELTGLTAAAADSFNHIIAASGNIQSVYGSSWDDLISSGENFAVRDILHENTLLIKLAVICNGEPAALLDSLVSALANSLYAAWFRLRYTAFNTYSSRSELLLSLLRGDKPVGAEPLCGPFIAAVIPSTRTNQGDMIFDILASAENDDFLFVHDNNEYIFLFNANDVLLSKLNNFGKRHHLVIGISRTFVNIEDASSHRIQARDAAAAAARFPDFAGCAAFDRMKLFSMFETLSANHMGQSMMDPQVELLAKSDREKNTGFMRTLFCWLLNSQHASAAAKQLGVHRNTLDNRLSKINELIDADWNSCTYSTCMLYSLYVTLADMGQLEYFE